MSESFAVTSKRIYARFDPLRIVTGITVVNGRIVYSGDRAKARRIARELGGEVIDFDDKIVMPGFIDAHLHMDGIGACMKGVDLHGVSSIRELVDRVREFAYANPDLRVIWGIGWDQELFSEGRWPRKEDIDRAVGDIPVVLSRVCGHAALLNSAALEMLLEDLPEGMEKYIIRDEKGEPTGIVIEDLTYLVWKKILTLLDYREVLLKASRYLASNGVTTVGFMSADTTAFRVLQELEEEDLLRTRVYVYFEGNGLDLLASAGIRRNTGMELVKSQGVKFFVDGSLGARTAFLSEEYSDDPGNKGKLLLREDELATSIRKAVDAGLQPAVHAIGDGAVDVVLKAIRMSRVRGENVRIEHASVLRDDQINLIREMGVKVCVQPRFAVSDWWAPRRLGRRVRWLYRLKTLVEKGVEVGVSTDAPVEPVNPWLTVCAAVGDSSGEKGHIRVSETVKLEKALYLYTRGSGKLFGENTLGVLEPGSPADFIVVNKDPFVGSNVLELAREAPLHVFVAGRRVF